MPSYSPHLIDSGTTPESSTFPIGPGASVGWAQQNNAFVYRNQLYFVGQRASSASGALQTINVFRAIDPQGTAWTLLDGAHAPQRGDKGNTGGCWFDGNQTITVAWTDANYSPPTAGTIHLQDFDLATATWGMEYGNANSPTVYIVNQIYRRSDGSLLALFNRFYDATYGPEGLAAAVFSGGAWGTPFPLDSNMSAAYVIPGPRTAVAMESDGTLDIFVQQFDTATRTQYTWFYQKLLPDDTLGAFHQFSVTDMTAFVHGQGNPIIVGDMIVWGGCAPLTVFPQYALLAIGTPLSAPVWSFTPAPGIDPSAPFSAGATYYVADLALSATTIYALIAISDTSQDPADFSLRLGSTTNLTNPNDGWTFQTIYDFTQGPFPFAPSNSNVWDVRSLSVYNPGTGDQVFVSAAVYLAGNNTDTTYWFGDFSPASSVTIPGGPVGGGPGVQTGLGPFAAIPGVAGVPWVVSACKRRNHYDWCLLAEDLRMQKIKFPPMCTIPPEYRDCLPWEGQYGAIPPQAVLFKPAKGILTPTPAAGDQIVLEKKMPNGYDGWMTGVFQSYTGTGFEQGSGDILWRIQLNQRYVKDFSNNPFLMGLPIQPFPLLQGQLLLAGQTVRYIVNVPNLSGNIQVGASQIVCGLYGFAWPRG